MLAPYLLATPALLLAPLKAPLNAATMPRLASVRMEEEKLSILDTTDKFDEIAAGAASSSSAALALGREPGTCDPYDPKSSDFCMEEEPSDKDSGAHERDLLTLLPPPHRAPLS